MKRIIPLILAVMLLGGCRGGGLVFKGFHADQDKALLECLAEKYPDMEFVCQGRAEGSVHSMQAGDGTEFPAWTAAGSRGSFQLIDYYLPEWLAGQGFFTELEEELSGLGFGWDYSSYNHYDRHFQPDFGPLDSPERLGAAARFLSWAKERFDALYEDFQAGTGCQAPLLYFNSEFTLNGSGHFKMTYLSMRDSDQWGFDYSYDDYESVLRDAVEQSKHADSVPKSE